MEIALSTDEHMGGNMPAKHSLLATILTIGLTAQLAASDVNIANNTLHLKSTLSADTVQMTVSGPKDFHFSQNRSGGDVSISLDDIEAYEDGLYKYEITEIESAGERQVNDEFNGRGHSVQKIVTAKTISGHFRIEGGAVVDSTLQEKDIRTNIPFFDTEK